MSLLPLKAVFITVFSVLPDFLTIPDLILMGAGALLMGMAKSGISGINIIAIPVFASLFGGRTSTSIILPLLISGDILAMAVYKSKISWKHYFRLLPTTLVGLLAGMFLGGSLPDRTFRLTMAVIILVCLVLMLIKEFGNRNLQLPDHWAAHGASGFAGGFTTMVGNAAGPVMAIYLLSMKLPKEIFIGTGAVFFMTVNLLKVPIHLFAWQSMDISTFKIDAVLVPLVFLGFFLGLKIVKRIPERPFRLLIIAATLAGTIKMFF